MRSLIYLGLIAGCSLFTKTNNEMANGHFQLYSTPEKVSAEKIDSDVKRLMFVSTNDWRGQLEATQVVARDTHSPEKSLLSVGGVEVFARYLEILRDVYKDQVVLIDAGNSISGSLMTRNTNGRAVVDAFAQLKYDAMGLSTEDFAAGPELRSPTSPTQWMPKLFQNSKTPVVVSNLINLKKATPVEWGNTLPQLIKEVNGVKIGFIGLVPDDLPRKLDSSVLNGLYVEPSQLSFLRQLRSLKLKGAQVIVLIKHGGVSCGETRAIEKKLPLAKVNFDPKDPDVCDKNDKFVKFLEELPMGSVDLVITGGAQGKVANFINSTPVIQAMGKGSSFARVEIFWSQKEKKILTDKTVIHQPTLICHRFFKATEDCYEGDSSIDHRELAPATFMGEVIFPDAFTAFFMNEWRGRDNEPLIDNSHSHTLGQEMADSLVNTTLVDVGVIGGDKWNLNLPKGAMTWKDLYQQSEAKEKIYQVTLSGLEFQTLKAKIHSSAWFASLKPDEEFYHVDSMTVALNATLWHELSQTHLKDKVPALHNLVIADTLVTWQKDSVSSKASGRSPALPRTPDEVLVDNRDATNSIDN